MAGLAMLQDGQRLGARFQVRRSFAGQARNGGRFMSCELWDGHDVLKAYAWEQECRGYHVPRRGEWIYAAGRIRRRTGRLELVCRELKVEDAAERIRWAREHLRAILRDLPPVLYDLVRRIFTDPAIGPAFLIAPASLNHHHAFSGGLLVHSAEVAGAVFRWTAGESVQGLATVAALLHDIGKVRTLAGNMTRTVLGQQVRHEALTLEVVAAHLAWFDGAWPEGAILLRHLLTAEARRDRPSPALAALELVHAADRISAADASAFTTMP
ncbi:HD domain-containing protein [Thiocapsa sp.]|uniref:HD domain-containing protein n=1 Tax=Thiocapsa sp. TaxID=2024551 RepID=UPI002CCD30F4|nr:TraI domain-containing protein [Thiocapsa sp.]HSO82496.1 TraI domain-containing protein [Thiocapsa sp.]